MNPTSQNPVKVCFIAPKAYPLFNPKIKQVFGGAEVDLYYLATELAQDEKFEVSFIVADYGQPPVETVEKVTVIKSLDFARNPFLGARRIWKALKQADADVHLIKTASPGVPLLAAFCRRFHKAFIYRTAHQDECDGTYMKKHFFLGRAFARSLQRANMVLAQNEIDQHNLQRTLGVSALVIPNGHRLPDTPALNRDTIIWVGRTAAFKNPRLFLELAGKFPREKFIMICQKATGDHRYDDLIRQAQNTANLEFLPRVPFHEIGDYFRRAKVLVNTSDAEGFPNTFIQACIHGTPILSLNVNPDEFLTEYSCGLCCSGNPQRLAESLDFLLTKDRYIELGKKGLKYVRQHHDIKKIIGRYKTIFASALAEAGPAVAG